MALVKVCGIRSVEAAVYAAECGADALGFVFAPSRRRVVPDVVRAIVRSLPRSTWKVGVFVDEDPAMVRAVIEYCGLDTVQLHGNESPECCGMFPVRVLKAIRVKGNRLLPDPGRYRPYAFLLDTFVEGAAGGTGRAFEWGLARRFAELAGLDADCRVIVAGGLSPANVRAALDTADPYGVDVSSGVETDGEKDFDKIRLFIQEVRRWENARVA